MGSSSSKTVDMLVNKTYPVSVKCVPTGGKPVKHCPANGGHCVTVDPEKSTVQTITIPNLQKAKSITICESGYRGGCRTIPKDRWGSYGISGDSITLGGSCNYVTCTNTNNGGSCYNRGDTLPYSVTVNYK